MKHYDIIYDTECYPNWFCARFMHTVTGMLWAFELSDWANEIPQLVQFLNMCRSQSIVRLVGFNNLGYDYILLHEIIVQQGVGITNESLYAKSQSIFRSQENRFGENVKPWEITIPQVDLYKIHHFDNNSKRTSLKVLEFNMRSHSVEDMPFDFGIYIDAQQREIGNRYNFHDVAQTLKFYWESKALIDFRDELSAKHGEDYTNFNDTKIGKSYFVTMLELKSPGICYERGPHGGKIARQTQRDSINIGQIIFPYVQFTHPELNRVKNYLASQVITQTKGVFVTEDTRAKVDGFEFVLGVGGIHGSVDSRTIYATDEYCILDLDVAGYYPSLAIANRLYPQHLGEQFCEVYKDIVAQRRTYKKGTAENAMLKLAGNGVYGDSGNKYSPFYDLQYMISITVNGQLLLCMLAEQLMRVPTVELIQVNTDGVTLKCRRDQLPVIKTFTDWWQALTKLELEDGFYSSMFIRDVNAYLAVSEDGKKIKRKGPFSWVRGYNLGAGELAWHQDQSALIVPMAAEEHLLNGADIAAYIHGHRDIFDFAMLAKAAKGAKLQLDDGTKLSKTLRYIVSHNGRQLQKVMLPAAGCKPGDYKRANSLTNEYFFRIEAEIGGSQNWDARIHTKNKNKYEATKTSSINAGWKCKPCNTISDVTFNDIDYNYYIGEAEALVRSVGYEP